MPKIDDDQLWNRFYLKADGWKDRPHCDGRILWDSKELGILKT